MGTAEDYEKHPVLRALGVAAASFIPGVAQVAPVLDAALAERGKAMRTRRLEVLLEALREGVEELTPEVVRSEPFLNAFFRTAEVAVRTERREKIRYFARLLLAGIGEQARYDLARDHEDYLKLLDDLTYRELGVLAIFGEFMDVWRRWLEATPRPSVMKWIWADFVTESCRRLSLSEQELGLTLARLNRTGLYVHSFGTADEENIYRGVGQGVLTSNYFRLAELIQLTAWEQVPEESS